MKRGIIVLLGFALCGGGAWYYAHKNKPELLAKVGLAASLGSSPGNTSGGKPAGAGKPGGKPAGRARGRRGPGGPVTVATDMAQKGSFPVRLYSIGFVEPVATVVVKSRLQSQLLAQHVKEGQMVKKGDLLFTLDDREALAQVAKDEAQVAKSQATLARVRNDIKRAKLLLSRNAGTQLSLELAIASENELLATIAGDKAVLANDRVRLSYAKIYAPIDGRIGVVGVTPGNLVNTGDNVPAMVTITKMKPVSVNFTLPERELSRIRAAIDKGDLPRVEAIARSGDRQRAIGKITFVDSSVDRLSGTITLKAEITNENLELWPGQYSDVTIDLSPHENAVSVPAVAIQQGQKGPFVYTVTDQLAVQLRYIKTGLTNNDRVEITSGLSGNERVVTEGQLRLSPGAKVRVLPPKKQTRPAVKPAETAAGE